MSAAECVHVHFSFAQHTECVYTVERSGHNIDQAPEQRPFTSSGVKHYYPTFAAAHTRVQRAELH